MLRRRFGARSSGCWSVSSRYRAHSPAGMARSPASQRCHERSSTMTVSDATARVWPADARADRIEAGSGVMGRDVARKMKNDVCRLADVRAPYVGNHQLASFFRWQGDCRFVIAKQVAGGARREFEQLMLFCVLCQLKSAGCVESHFNLPREPGTAGRRCNQSRLHDASIRPTVVTRQRIYFDGFEAVDRRGL